MSTTWPAHIAMNTTQQRMHYAGVSSGTEGTLALDSAYTYGSAGDCIMAMAFISPESANLTDIWFKVKSYNGTWGSTDGNINWEIREGLNGLRIPGTTLTASGTFALDGSTTGWHRITGLTVALTAGKMYCLVLADADGGATNYVTLVSRYGTADQFQPIAIEVGTATNGFASAYTSSSSAPACVVKIGSVYLAGQIWDAVSTVTNGTYERGVRFRPKEDCTFIGFGYTIDSVALVGGHGLKLYADATSPGGSTLTSSSVAATTLGGGTAPLENQLILPSSAWYDLSGGTWYRCVFDPASATTTPRKATVSGSPDATLLAAAMPMGGDYYWTEESGGAWVDDTDAIALFGPILVPKTAAGGGLLTHPGMSGGMRG